MSSYLHLALVLAATACSPAPITAGNDDLGPALAEAVNVHAPVLEDRDVRYVPARVGWMRTRSMELFRYLNGDLFPEATEQQAPPSPAETAIAALVATRDLLAERDVEFLVVVFPTRLNVYPESLCDVEVGDDFAGYAPGLGQVIRRLEAEGVEVLELLPHFAAERVTADAPIDEQVFLTHNSHWSPKGLDLTARLLAQEIESRPWFDPSAALLADRASALSQLPVPWRPLNEPLPTGATPHLVMVEPIRSPDGTPAPASNPDSPIVLLGDSFSTIYEEHAADFPRHLAHHLGSPIDLIASAGGGPQSSRASLARRRNALDGKRLVIWSFASHALMNTRWWQPREH